MRRFLHMFGLVLLLGVSPLFAQIAAHVSGKLLPSDGNQGRGFGGAVALDGDTAIIGASLDDDQGLSSGAAYVFRRNGGAWDEQAKLFPSDGNRAEDFFGWEVSVSDDTAIIGAPFDDPRGLNSGSAYIFVGDGDSWVEQAKLIPSDGSSIGLFGLAAVIDGDTAIVSASLDDEQGPNAGAAYVYQRNGNVWDELTKLLPNIGVEGDEFGRSVVRSL